MPAENIVGQSRWQRMTLLGILTFLDAPTIVASRRENSVDKAFQKTAGSVLG